MNLTEKELAALRQSATRIERLTAFLDQNAPPSPEMGSQEWFTYLAKVKSILGNFNNNLSLVSCLMAKDYLTSRHSIVPFDVAEKPQGASGLDIDARTTSNERVIGEIKTTTPYKGAQFGAAQIAALRKDFHKLRQHQADYKYMFVTDLAAFNAIRQSFAHDLPGVMIACLTSGDLHQCSEVVCEIDQ